MTRAAHGCQVDAGSNVVARGDGLTHKTRTAALWFVASPPRDVDSVCLSVCLSGTYAAGTLANLFHPPLKERFAADGRARASGWDLGTARGCCHGTAKLASVSCRVHAAL